MPGRGTGRKNTIMGRHKRNTDSDFPEAKINPRRLGKAVISNQKKYGTVIGTGYINTKKLHGKYKKALK